MHNNWLAVLFGLAGAVSGYMIPVIAEKITLYKYRKKGAELTEDERFTNVPLRAALAVSNAGAWAFAGYQMENSFVAFSVSLLISIAIIIAIIDLRVRIIPNELVLTVMVIGACFQSIYFGIMGIVSAAICMAVIMLIFTLVAFMVGLGKIGAGDIKLVGAMGLALGYPYIFTALIIMSLVIILYCVFGIIIRKLNRTSVFPFAPFIMLGMVSSFVLILSQSSKIFVAF